jgi:hypothetical protein
LGAPWLSVTDTDTFVDRLAGTLSRPLNLRTARFEARQPALGLRTVVVIEVTTIPK